MKVSRKLPEDRQTSFHCIAVGEAFLYKRVPYMRIYNEDKATSNVVDLRTGMACYLAPAYKVLPIDASVVYDENV